MTDTAGPHIVVGHEMLLSPKDPTEVLVPRQRPQSGYVVTCLCGRWAVNVVTRREARDTYRREHLRQARLAALSECRTCRRAVPPAERSADPRYFGVCKGCRRDRVKAWAEAHPTEWERSRRAHHFRKKYGITIEDAEALLARQGDVCAICRTPPADARGYRMHVDHDHKTGKVRGILCGSCNRGLGNFRDDADRLVAAALYLRDVALIAVGQQ